MTEKQRVLLCGDVEGRFKLLFNKVDAINKKSGPFDFLFCVGNFFGKNNADLEPFKAGTKTISVPTYIMGPNDDEGLVHYTDPTGGEICTNLTYLGKHGLYTASSGLKIAYLSGVEKGKDVAKECSFDHKDVTALRNSCLKGCPSFRGVDVLLTSQWPEGISNLDEQKPDFEYQGSRLISWLATHIKPRYHVSGLENVHYERSPYRNQHESQDGINIATRFIALAKVANPEKKKWLYALNLTPLDKTKITELMMKTTDETPSPYPQSMLQNNPNKKTEEQNQYFYDMESKNDKKKIKRAKMEFDQSKCWFCLSSQDCAKHLVISAGKDIYLALAKGGIVDDHFLILPVTHYQSISILPDNVKEELRLYKEAIKLYCALNDRVPVFFERNFKTSHCQLQAVPIHKNQAPALKETFQEIAGVYHITMKELNEDLKEVAPPGAPYFLVEFPNGEQLFYKIKKDFPLQFGREVLCSDRILDVPDRFDWKDCQLSREKEYMLAENIKAKFRPFDVKL
ncbi:CWF19-like protein 1 [Copidosoma floridanum]|uniref:CWF19-like protein 1 n=1 Tax=Copidosoma floridanum TaxID=29053 RepID=UPI0006C9A81A|nr:CWF19-like protein 1 [Copidosoma floridanum]